MKIRERYKLNKTKKVGDSCVCPSCGTEFIKKQHQQAFCKSKPGTKCKDKYWNTVIPEKRNNTTRISPASQRWLDNKERDYDYRSGDYYEHPFSSEALGQ